MKERELKQASAALEQLTLQQFSSQKEIRRLKKQLEDFRNQKINDENSFGMNTNENTDLRQENETLKQELSNLENRFSSARPTSVLEDLTNFQSPIINQMEYSKQKNSSISSREPSTMNKLNSFGGHQEQRESFSQSDSIQPK